MVDNEITEKAKKIAEIKTNFLSELELLKKEQDEVVKAFFRKAEGLKVAQLRKELGL